MVVILEEFAFPDVFVQTIISLHDWFSLSPLLLQLGVEVYLVAEYPVYSAGLEYGIMQVFANAHYSRRAQK